MGMIFMSWQSSFADEVVQAVMRPVQDAGSSQADQYTPIMNASTLAEVKAAMSTGCNVNGLTWQHAYLHYISALDVFNWKYGQNPSPELLAIIKYHKNIMTQLKIHLLLFDQILYRELYPNN